MPYQVEVWQRDNQYFLVEAAIGSRTNLTLRHGWYAEKKNLGEAFEMNVDAQYLRLNASHWRYGESAPKIAARIGSSGQFEAVKPFRCMMRWYKGYALALFPENTYGGPGLVHCFDTIGGWNAADYSLNMSQSRRATAEEYFDAEYALFYRCGVEIEVVKRRLPYRAPNLF